MTVRLHPSTGQVKVSVVSVEPISLSRLCRIRSRSSDESILLIAGLSVFPSFVHSAVALLISNSIPPSLGMIRISPT